jgi:hypothetical protein
MKKGIWILLAMMLVGVGIYVGSLVFAPRVAETPTPIEPGVAPEDTAYLTCWQDTVDGPWARAIEDGLSLSEAMGEGDWGTSKDRVSLLERDLQVVKAVLVACPTPIHWLLVASRVKALRAIDLETLSCEYLEEGLSPLDLDLITKSTDLLVESADPSYEAISDIQKYRGEVLGK